MIKELPLYLQPGGKTPAERRINQLKRQQNRYTRRGSRTGVSDNYTNRMQNKYDSAQAEIDKLSTEAGAKAYGNAVGEKREKAGQIASGIASGAATAMNAATALATSQMNIAEDSSFHGTQQVGQALSAFGPYGALAGAALTGAAALTEGLGIGTSQLSKTQANAAGLSGGQRFLNNIAGILAPGIGAALAKTNTATQKTEEAQSVSGAYADAISDIDAASTMGGKRYAVGAGQINALIAEANRKNSILTEVGRVNTLRKQSDYGQDLLTQNQRIYAGNNYMQSAIGKHGMKLASVDEIRKILEFRKGVEIFQNGGILSGNILPTGKLHKELHHIEDSNPELAEDLTRKGIPVVAVNEDGDFEEVAEIERDEWTTSKEVTEKLEALWKDGSEEAMLECGKFVCEQLLQFTRDDNNIIWENEKQQKNL